MTLKIIFFLTILAYTVIVSQSIMYILSLQHAQMQLSAGSYLELRKLIDGSMRSNFKYVLYSAVLLNLVLLILSGKQPGSVLFVTTAIALVALVADILLTVKGNLPINDMINTWTVDTIPSDWTHYRTKWFMFFQYRQVASITGFVSLLVGGVFGLKGQ